MLNQRHPAGKGTTWSYFFLPDCFRCHPQINHFPSQQYYGGSVKSFGTHRRSDGHYIFPPSSFIDVAVSNGDQRSSGRSSLAQTQVAEALLVLLTLLEGPQVMILVYYKDQYVPLITFVALCVLI